MMNTLSFKGTKIKWFAVELVVFLSYHEENIEIGLYRFGFSGFQIHLRMTKGRKECKQAIFASFRF